MHRPISLLVSSLLLLSPSVALAQSEAEEATARISELIRWGGVVTSLFIIVGAYLLLRFVENSVASLSRRFAGRRLLLHKLGTFFQFFVYIGTTALVFVLSFRFDDKVLAVLGGTIAVSVGFAVKDLVASFIAGITVLVDRPFQVGDRVQFGGEYGDIVTIGLRSVQLRTLDDSMVTIPNNKFLSDITSNANFGELDMLVAMDFHIGLDQNVAHAREIVIEAGLSSRFAHLPKPITVLIKQVVTANYVAIRLRLKAYVLDTRFEKAFETDVNLRVLDAFAAANIQPPAILHRLTAATTEKAPVLTRLVEQ